MYVKHCLISPNGKYITLYTDKIYVFELANFKRIICLEGNVEQICYTSDSNQLIIMNNDYLKIWNLETGKLFRQITKIVFTSPKDDNSTFQMKCEIPLNK